MILMARIKYQEAAGLEVKRGRPPAGPAPTKADLVKLYVREGRSVRDVAAALGCSKDAVHRGRKQYGIDARPNASRSRLRTIPLRDLKVAIRAKGISGTARDLLKSSRPLLFERARAAGSVRTRFPGLPHPTTLREKGDRPAQARKGPFPESPKNRASHFAQEGRTRGRVNTKPRTIRGPATFFRRREKNPLQSSNKLLSL